MIVKIIFLIMFTIVFYRKIKHGMHMLQLESYKNKRYIRWIKNNTEKTLKLNYEKPKKAFVITSRIKRMYITYIIFYIFIIALGFGVNKYIYGFILIFLCFIAHSTVIIANVVNAPIEKVIQKSFIKKAINKLENTPNLKVIGITGSYGKTSTKYIVSTILAQKYNVLMTPESYNTTMGVVRTINEKLCSTHNLFVCEMGAKQIGDIKEICDIVKPSYGILTAIGPQHLETFKTIDNVKKTKLELVDSLSQQGIAFLNYEDENVKNSEIDKNKITFGLCNECDYYAKNIEINEFGSSFAVCTPKGNLIDVKTKLLGKHNIINIVGAIAVSDTLGLSVEEIQAGVRFLKPIPHRLELKVHANGNIVIDDAYNSNIKGAQMALEVLRNFKDKKRILVTPGIVDLGKENEKYNKILGNFAASSADYIILVGEKQANPIKAGILEKSFQEENIFIAKNLNEAINKMNEIGKQNSVILLENDLPDNYL